VSRVATGGDHSCALVTGGQVRCWGRGFWRQLGNNATTAVDRYRPVRVVDISGSGALRRVTAISAGGDTTCALVTGGEVRCWGRNDAGQVGAGQMTTFESSPRIVVDGIGRALTGITQVSVGLNSTCARTAVGRAWCWGDNSRGQLGTGDDTGSTAAVPVRNAAGNGPLTGVTSVSVGDAHTCARLVDGQARCWGANPTGALGIGVVGDRSLPTPVVAKGGPGTRLTGVVSVQAGNDASCALLANRRVRCWGYGSYGILGNGDLGNALRPVAVRNVAGTAELGSVTQLSLGAGTACVRLASGQARCWGYGGSGAAGNGEVEENVSRPAIVRSGTPPEP
jgi:alpha-tubulin suppressor-like RCC1 family protein